MHLKDVWRSAGMKSGELCVMISGQVLMEPWLAGNWDFLQQVLHSLQENYIVCPCTAHLQSSAQLSLCRCKGLLSCNVWPGHWPYPPRQLALQ